MRSILSVVALTSMVFACSAPADDAASEGSSEAALSSSSSITVASYRGNLAIGDADYAIEVTVEHPESLRTTQTVRGSQIMSDSPHCDTYLDSYRGNVSLRVLGANGSVVAETNDLAYFNSSAMLDDSACPLGILASRKPSNAKLEVSAVVDGVSFKAGEQQISVPFGYGSVGSLEVLGSAEFKPTGRSSFAGKREADRGSSTVTTRGIATIEFPSTLKVNVGLGFMETTPVTLERTSH